MANRLPARTLIEALGRTTGADVLRGSQMLLATLHKQEPYDGVTIARDVAYGPDERHRLDVYEPTQGASGRPVLMFVHGGGFVRGDKTTPGLPFYDNIGVWAARNGMVGVNITYRRLPRHRHPAGIEDVAAAIAWVKAHIGDHGGDGARILLYGSSAGAALIASYVASPSVHAIEAGKRGPGIAGLIVSSGYYDFTAMGDHETIAPYFGEEAARFSSLEGVVASGVPVVVSVGEFEERKYQEQALLLATALFRRNGELPKFIIHAGHNHYTSVMAMGLDDNDPVLAAIRNLSGV